MRASVDLRMEVLRICLSSSRSSVEFVGSCFGEFLGGGAQGHRLWADGRRACSAGQHVLIALGQLQLPGW